MGSFAACVHRPVSTHPGPPSGFKRPAVRCPARPVSSPSGVRSSGSLVRTRLSGRPVSSRLASARVASVSSHVSRTVGIGDTSERRGNRHDWNPSSSV
jgi:hypothetical protein